MAEWTCLGLQGILVLLEAAIAATASVWDGGVDMRESTSSIDIQKQIKQRKEDMNIGNPKKIWSHILGNIEKSRNKLATATCVKQPEKKKQKTNGYRI